MDYEPLAWQKVLGYTVDPARCRASVHETRGIGSHQCTRKPKAGERYCATHSPAAIERRAEAADKRYQESLKRDRERRGGVFLDALRQIAAGHNDPRSLAIETIRNAGLEDTPNGH